ncbi:MAG: hypothetical protein LBT80_05675 [Lactobacillaceae bacterium]|jgi:hypothetical protein|nr:hypothetical protein [Lactobacillaceae bacterium]
MNQPWWQHKIVWGLGLLGAVMWVLTPLLGALVWPLYQPVQHPIAILTAADNTFRTVFVNFGIMAGLFIMIFLLALSEYFKHEKQHSIANKIFQVMLTLLFLLAFDWFWPLRSISQAALVPHVWQVRDGVAGVILVLVALSYWQLGRSLEYGQQRSLGNLWRLAGVLLILFALVAGMVNLLGWPLTGLFDQLQNLVTIVPIFYTSWHIIRLAEHK